MIRYTSPIPVPVGDVLARCLLPIEKRDDALQHASPELVQLYHLHQSIGAGPQLGWKESHGYFLVATRDGARQLIASEKDPLNEAL